MIQGFSGSFITSHQDQRPGGGEGERQGTALVRELSQPEPPHTSARCQLFPGSAWPAPGSLQNCSRVRVWLASSPTERAHRNGLAGLQQAFPAPTHLSPAGLCSQTCHPPWLGLEEQAAATLLRRGRGEQSCTHNSPPRQPDPSGCLEL